MFYANVFFSCDDQGCFFSICGFVMSVGHMMVFFQQQQVREGSDLVRIAGFLFLGSIPQVILYHSIQLCFEGFRWRFFSKTPILCFHPP